MQIMNKMKSPTQQFKVLKHLANIYLLGKQLVALLKQNISNCYVCVVMMVGLDEGKRSALYTYTIPTYFFFLFLLQSALLSKILLQQDGRIFILANRQLVLNNTIILKTYTNERRNNKKKKRKNTKNNTQNISIHFLFFNEKHRHSGPKHT